MAAPPPVQPVPPDSSAEHEETDVWQTPPAPPTTPPPSQPWRPSGPDATASAAAPVAWQQPTAPPPSGTPQPPPPGPWQQPGQQPYGQAQYPSQAQYPAQMPYGPQGAYAAGPPAASRRGTSVAAVLGGLLLLVLAVGMAVAGGWLYTQGNEMGRFIRDNSISLFNNPIPRETLRSLASILPATLIVFGVLELLFAIGVLAHRSWGRWLGMLMALLGVVASVLAVAVALALESSLTLPALEGLTLLVAYALTLLLLLAGGGHFKARNTPG
jgi:hypothetical protein